jgi:hypothetical protein
MYACSPTYGGEEYYQNGIATLYSNCDELIIEQTGNSPISFITYDTKRLTIGGAGNLSVGTTAPWSWGSTIGSVQVGTYGSLFANIATAAGGGTYLTHNLYYNGTNWQTVNTNSDESSYLLMANGELVFAGALAQVASAGVPIPYNHFYLSAAGKLAIGPSVTTPTYNLQITNSVNSHALGYIENTSTGASAYSGFMAVQSSAVYVSMTAYSTAFGASGHNLDYRGNALFYGNAPKLMIEQQYVGSFGDIEFWHTFCGNQVLAVKISNKNLSVEGLKTGRSYPTNFKTVYVNTDTGELFRYL